MGTSSGVPTLNTNLSTQVGNESTLADLTTVPTGITATDTENQNNLTLYSAAGAAAIKLTYGIIFEGKIFNTAFSTWDAYTASVDNFWDHMDSQIEADSNYNSVTRVETDSAARADFTITAPLGQESTITPSFTQNGSSFSDAVQFSGYVAASGMASTADAYLYIRKYNANNAYKIAGTLGTTDYVRIDFQTNNTTTATTSYTTNPVEINVADFATDANLWDKVLEAINNHGNISGSVTRANDTFTLVSTNTGMTTHTLSENLILETIYLIFLIRVEMTEKAYMTDKDLNFHITKLIQNHSHQRLLKSILQLKALIT